MTTTYLPEVPVTRIQPHGANPRRDIGDVADLAASIASKGLLEPLVVAPIDGTNFRLIAGHRRYAALKTLGHKTAPALARDDLDTPPKQLEAMLVENTQRQDLSPVEEADAYAQLVAFPGMTQAKAAKETGRSLKVVRARLAIAGLPETARARVHTGAITLEQAATLAEWAGTPQYASLERAAGTGQFPHAVESAKRDKRAQDFLTAVKAECESRGWPIVTDRPAHANTVISQWSLPTGGAAAALAKLDGDHILLVGQHSWSLLKPYDADDEDDDTDDAHITENRAALNAAREARLARYADVDTARQVRLTWLQQNAWQQRIGKDERLTLLRLLFDRELEFGWEDEETAMAYLPDSDLDGRELAAFYRDWASTVDEPKLWRALLTIMFNLGSCGYPNSDQGHDMSIRLAMALGYEPSDVELALLTPEATA